MAAARRAREEIIAHLFDDSDDESDEEADRERQRNQAVAQPQNDEAASSSDNDEGEEEVEEEQEDPAPRQEAPAGFRPRHRIILRNDNESSGSSSSGSSSSSDSDSDRSSSSSGSSRATAESEPEFSDLWNDFDEPAPQRLNEGTNNPALIIAPNRTVDFQLWSKEDVIEWAKLVIPGRTSTPTIRNLRNIDNLDGEILRDLATDITILGPVSRLTRKLRDHAAKLINEYNQQRQQRGRAYREVVRRQREQLERDDAIDADIALHLMNMRRHRWNMLDEADPAESERIRAALTAEQNQRAEERLDVLNGPNRGGGVRRMIREAVRHARQGDNLPRAQERVEIFRRVRRDLGRAIEDHEMQRQRMMDAELRRQEEEMLREAQAGLIAELEARENENWDEMDDEDEDEEEEPEPEPRAVLEPEREPEPEPAQRPPLALRFQALFGAPREEFMEPHVYEPFLVGRQMEQVNEIHQNVDEEEEEEELQAIEVDPVEERGPSPIPEQIQRERMVIMLRDDNADRVPIPDEPNREDPPAGQQIDIPIPANEAQGLHPIPEHGREAIRLVMMEEANANGVPIPDEPNNENEEQEHGNEANEARVPSPIPFMDFLAHQVQEPMVAVPPGLPLPPQPEEPDRLLGLIARVQANNADGNIYQPHRIQDLMGVVREEMEQNLQRQQNQQRQQHEIFDVLARARQNYQELQQALQLRNPNPRPVPAINEQAAQQPQIPLNGNIMDLIRRAHNVDQQNPEAREAVVQDLRRVFNLLPPFPVRAPAPPPRAPAEPLPRQDVPQQAQPPPRANLGYNAPGLEQNALVRRLEDLNNQHPPLAIELQEAVRIFQVEAAAAAGRRRRLADDEERLEFFRERRLQRQREMEERQRVPARQRPAYEQRAEAAARGELQFRERHRAEQGLPEWTQEERNEAYERYLEAYRDRYRLDQDVVPLRDEELAQIRNALERERVANGNRDLRGVIRPDRRRIPERQFRRPVDADGLVAYDEGPVQPPLILPYNRNVNYLEWRPGHVVHWITLIAPARADHEDFINTVMNHLHGGALIEELARDPTTQQRFQLSDELYTRLKYHAARVVNEYWARHDRENNAQQQRPVRPEEPIWRDEGPDQPQLILPEGQGACFLDWTPLDVANWICAVFPQDNNQEVRDRIIEEQHDGTMLLHLDYNEEEVRRALGNMPDEKYNRLRFHAAKVHNHYIRGMYDNVMVTYNERMAAWLDRNR